MGYQLVLVPTAVRSATPSALVSASSSNRSMALGLYLSAPITLGGKVSRPRPSLSHSFVTPCHTLLASWYSTRRNPSTRGNLEFDAPTDVGAFQAASTAGLA